MDDAKVYNVCLMRLRFQIENAKKRARDSAQEIHAVLLESYRTGDLEDIIDILEIYDIESRTPEGLRKKLEDLASTVSLLMRERIAFGYDDKGHLGIYYVMGEAEPKPEGTGQVELASA